jgi:hypothetical protein
MARQVSPNAKLSHGDLMESWISAQPYQARLCGSPLAPVAGSAIRVSCLFVTQTDKPAAQAKQTDCAAHGLDEQLRIAVLNVRATNDENGGSKNDDCGADGFHTDFAEQVLDGWG